LFLIGCRYRWIPWLCLCPAAVMLSCHDAPKARVEEKPPPDRLLESVPNDRYADDLARFLAGLPGRSGSPFIKLQDEPAWARHRQEFDRSWNRLEGGPLPAMRAFQNSEFGSRPAAAQPVFYPFSGPDALMVTVFFPHTPVYIMVGLEPAGTLPNPKQLGRKNLERYLSAVRSTVASELGRSFFITRQMDRQFRGQVTDGLCLPILELLVRSGHTVLGMRYIRLDENGRIVERASDYHAPGRIGNKGLEIEFRTDSDQSVHKLFYYSVNLSDTRLRENPPFLSFLSRLQGTTTFLKATSYMLHQPEFSIIREQVLSKSVAVLQDDSGIPFRFYTSPDWQVQLYGEYVRPYGSFRWKEQLDLRKAYQTPGTKPLQFRIGYGYGKVPSNLLFASRLK
jgi:hypothetical protein